MKKNHNQTLGEEDGHSLGNSPDSDKEGDDSSLSNQSDETPSKEDLIGHRKVDLINEYEEFEW